MANFRTAFDGCAAAAGIKNFPSGKDHHLRRTHDLLGFSLAKLARLKKLADIVTVIETLQFKLVLERLTR